MFQTKWEKIYDFHQKFKQYQSPKSYHFTSVSDLELFWGVQFLILSMKCTVEFIVKTDEGYPESIKIFGLYTVQICVQHYLSWFGSFLCLCCAWNKKVHLSINNCSNFGGTTSPNKEASCASFNRILRTISPRYIPEIIFSYIWEKEYKSYVQVQHPNSQNSRLMVSHSWVTFPPLNMS